MYTQTSTDPCLSVLSIKHSSCGKYVKKNQKHPYSKVKTALSAQVYTQFYTIC